MDEIPCVMRKSKSAGLSYLMFLAVCFHHLRPSMIIFRHCTVQNFFTSDRYTIRVFATNNYAANNNYVYAPNLAVRERATKF